MTKEQIINHLRYVQRELSEARGSDHSGVKALEEAIKELSSVEKNGNSIDRQKVLNTLDFADNALIGEDRTVETYKELLTECIKVLPSAENKGEWILQPSNKEQGERDFIWWKCSKCGQVIYSETEHDRREFHAFCGRCGADMRGET